MLQIIIPSEEQWDESKNEFVYSKPQIICLEHSLISLSKWESKWCKPFLSNKAKTTEETLDYVKCMTLTQNVGSEVYNRLSNENIDQVKQYIEAPMTATWFSEDKNRKAGPPNREQVTSELIYYWMIALNIPFECQKWHLNRLLTLIRVCNVKNQKPKKMNRRQLLSRNAAINAARRKKFSSKGV